MIAAGVVRALTWLATVPPPTVPPPTGPFPPVDQDPDDIRVEACKLVSRNPATCVTTPRPTVTDPPRTDSGGGGGFDTGFLSVFLWILLIAALLFAVVMVMRSLSKGASSRRSKDGEGADDDADDDEVIEEGAVFVDRSREPGDWRHQADEHRRAGRYREALRCRYRALVGDLARRGWIDEIPGRTTGEHRRQVREVTPAASPAFDAVAELFDGAWYGHLDVDERDDDRFRELERTVLAAAGERRR